MKDSSLVSTRVAVLPTKRENRLPYRLRGQFLSGPEQALYKALYVMVEGRYVICPKVGLNDVFTIVRPNENVHYFNKIFRKHVDFLLCHPRTMRPAFGVELVKPVTRDESRSADQFMSELFLSAGLPLVHIPSSEKYELPDLVNLFQLAVTKIQTLGPQVVEEGDSVPMCPVCGKMMVLRMYRNGPNKGKTYYGCMDNPHCPGVVVIE